jgi:hypothetical protein
MQLLFTSTEFLFLPSPLDTPTFVASIQTLLPSNAVLEILQKQQMLNQRRPQTLQLAGFVLSWPYW